jgi:hypothetical protein
MATSLAVQLRAAITATFTDDQDLTDPTAAIALSALESLANGTSNVQADLVYQDTFSIPLSSSTVLDMGTGGGMTTPFGGAFAPAEVVGFLLVADAGNTNNIIIGNNATEDFLGWFGAVTHTEAVKPDGWTFHFAPAGWAVANNSTDKIKLANSGAGTAVAGSVIIIARSA